VVTLSCSSSPPVPRPGSRAFAANRGQGAASACGRYPVFENRSILAPRRHRRRDVPGGASVAWVGPVVVAVGPEGRLAARARGRVVRRPAPLGGHERRADRSEGFTTPSAACAPWSLEPAPGMRRGSRRAERCPLAARVSARAGALAARRADARGLVERGEGGVAVRPKRDVPLIVGPGRVGGREPGRRPVLGNEPRSSSQGSNLVRRLEGARARPPHVSGRACGGAAAALSRRRGRFVARRSPEAPRGRP
jgi:hypothetical protein